LVIMDSALSPVQQRNLERAFKAKVIDRTGLILEIFGRRARTKEGRLQVELAHLAYQKSRLVRSWTHLERQRGGFGFLGGPGETQIEADRRIIQDRMYRLEQDLESVKRTRGLHRAGRARTPYPIVALVGYTNAGKSSLFNRLTQADVMAEDLLFATLDPTARVVKLPHGAPVILSDTVGFISDLPTQLVAAFRATLEDVIEADLILHIRDLTHADTDAQSEDVIAIMRDLGIDPDQHDRLIEVWNKIDQLDSGTKINLSNKAALKAQGHAPLLISALTGEGINQLLEIIEIKLSSKKEIYELKVPSAAGEFLAWLYREGEVLQRTDLDDGTLKIKLRLPIEKTAHLERRLTQLFPIN
jgi:GTPase